MARKKVAPLPPTPALGKRFWFEPNRRPYLHHVREQIAAQGGTVVEEVAADLDYLVLAPARRGAKTKPPPLRAAERLNKACGRIAVLYEDDLHRMLCPSRELALAVFRGGVAHRDFWAKVQPARSGAVRVDLAGADLRGLDLTGFDLRGCDLAGALLDGATMNDTWFSHVCDVDFRPAVITGGLNWDVVERCQFDGMVLPDFFFPDDLIACSFRGARLRGCKGQDDFSRAGCDFTEADLSEGELARWKATGLVALRAVFDRANLATADLSGADLAGARLVGAALGRANLTRTNLTDADLRDADLSGADLTGATLDRADFTGANLRDARYDRSAVRVAIGLGDAARAVRKPGPHLAQFQAELKPTRGTSFGFWLLSPSRGYCSIHLSNLAGHGPPSVYLCHGDQATNPHKPSWVAALLDLAAEWPDAVPLLDRVDLRLSRRPKATEALLCQALCELFGQPVPETKAVPAAREAATAATQARRDAAAAAVRERGAAAWNDLPEIARDGLDHLDGVDLSGADLRGIDFGFVGLRRANLAGADLREAKLLHAWLNGANLRGADLRDANLASAQVVAADAEGADLRGARLDNSIWTNANLRRADLRGASGSGFAFEMIDLRGADLSGAKLAGLAGTVRYDDATKLPAGFVPGEGWKNPDAPAEPGPAPVREELDFAAFYDRLPGVAEAGRIANAVEMLKADTFSLFAETTDEQVVGVVRSQSTPDRVYACRLTSAGQFECGTQNLRPCGGLRGAVCKHLLVLLLGMAKADALDPGTALLWLQASRRHRPAFDKEAMTATFLKYKGVEAGTVDWRPTETVPEDYYAL